MKAQGNLMENKGNFDLIQSVGTLPCIMTEKQTTWLTSAYMAASEN